MRGALLALAVVALAGGWLALAPAEVEAQAGQYEGLWLAKIGDHAVCTAQGDFEKLAGIYQRGSANALTLRFRIDVDGIGGCGPANVLTSGKAATQIGSWSLELRTATRGGGSLISGAHIGLPSSFSGRRTSGTHNRRASGSANDGAWPTHSDTYGTAYNNADITFTIPAGHSGAVFLRARADFVTTDGYTRTEDFSFQFNEPQVAAHPMVVPLDSAGEVDTSDVSVPSLRPSGGTSQRARLLLRDAAHGGAYHDDDANVARSAFGSATLKITSDAAGATAIANATISQSDGSSAIAACTESTAGNTCTVTSANWPQGSGDSPLTEPLDVYFQVPAAHTGSAYLVLTAARTNFSSRSFALEYNPTQISVHPLAASQNASGTIDTGNLLTATRSWSTGGAAQRAAIFLRSAAHGNAYNSAHANVARSAFVTAQIEIASDAHGAHPIAGAKIGSSSALTSAISACTETSVGNTCTITSGNFPQTGSPPLTQQVNIYFSVPDAHEGTAYVVVRASSATTAPRTFALPYNVPAQIAAHPLPVPVYGSVPGAYSGLADWDLTLAGRRFAGSGGRQQVRVFVRDAARTAYDASHANAARSAFDSVTITVATDEAGATALANAVISDAAGTVLSACNEATAGNTCTIPSGSFPQGSGGSPLTTHQDIWFSVPNNTSSAVYLVVSAAKSGQRSSSLALKYDLPPSRGNHGVFGLVNGDTAVCQRVAGHAVMDAGGYNAGATTSVTLNPRLSAYGSANCTLAAAANESATHDLYYNAGSTGGQDWELSLNHSPGDGTPIAGATITLTGFGTRTGGHNPRNSSVDGNWPSRAGHTQNRQYTNGTLSFTLPASHSGPVYLYVRYYGNNRVNTSEGTAEVSFKFEPALAAYPLAVPQDSSGTLETGDVTTATRRYAVNDATQRAAIFLRDDEHGNEYDAADTNVPRSVFDSVTIVIAEDEEGSTAISGAKISSDSAGNTAIAACTEATAGDTCTIPSGSYPQGSGMNAVTSQLDIYLSVPEAHPGPAYLVVKVERAGSPTRTFALEYLHPFVPVWPMAAPQDAGGTVDTTALSGARAWPGGGASQAARVFFRDEPRTAYDATQQAPLASNFASLTITVASDAAGQNVISGAKISSDAAGITSVGACDESAAGDTCTVQTANFPKSGQRTTNLDIYFSVPAAHAGDVYLVLSAAKTPDLPRVFALKFDNLSLFPLAAPLTGGNPASGNLATTTRSFAAAGASQQARVALREAWHDNEWDASDTNAERGDFDTATIAITSDAAGATVISGAKISSDSAGNTAVAACTETAAGDTCTITSANWPQATTGTPLRTLAQDLYFSVPAGHIGDAYLAVTATETGVGSRMFALKYETSEAGADPLAAPAQASNGAVATSLEAQDVTAQTVRWESDGAQSRARVFLRSSGHGNTYRAADANAARAGFDSVRIRAATSAGGGTEFSGIELIASDGVDGSSICTEPTAGPTCTITAANWPVASGLTEGVDIRFAVPANTDTAVHLHVSVSQAGKTARTFALQYQTGAVSAYPLAAPVTGTAPDTGDLTTPIRSFRSEGARQQVRVALREAWHGNEWDANDDNAERSDFNSAVIEVGTKNASGVFSALSNAAIYGASSGSGALAACTESTAGNTCTITSASWGQDSGTPMRTTAIDIWFSVPTATTDDVFVRVRATSSTSGVSARSFELKYEPYLRIWPLIVPAPSGTRETGNVKTSTRDWAGSAAVNQAEVYLRAAAHSDTYSGSGVNVARSAFDSVKLRLATTSAGLTSASGPVFTQSGGTNFPSECNETQGAICTIPAGTWPQGTGGTPLTLLQNIYFTVPDDHADEVWLVIAVKKANKTDRVYSIRYDVPYAAYPLVVPASTADGTDIGAGSRNFLPAGATQQFTVHLRDAWHDDTYDASDTNIATTALTDVTITIASDTAGASPVTGAELSSDSAGNTAVAGCAAVGNSCTITAANWPASSGTTTGNAIYFSVPNTVSTPVYIVVEADPSASGKLDRRVALRYQPPLAVYPLAVPLGASDAHETGDLTARTGAYGANAARQKARIYLRNAWHGNEYDSTDSNAATSEFNSVTIRIATGSDGATAVTGAAITNATGGRLTQCASAGATCAISSWPASAGTSQPLDVWFTVPDSYRANAYLHVTARNAAGYTQTFATPYESPYIAAYPLIVPQPTATTYETGTLSSNTRTWLPEGGVHRVSFFLRDQARTSYDASHGNAAAAAYDGLTMKITSDAAGNTLLANAAFTSSTGAVLTACNMPSSTPNDCTSTTPGTIFFTIPDAHTGDAYIHLTVTKSGKLSRATSLKWDAPSTVAAHPLARPQNASGTVIASAGEYNREGNADRVRISIRAAASGSTGAAVANFDRVIITAASNTDGSTAVASAVISSDGAASSPTALTGCTEGSTAGNVCTIPAASWPATGGVADDLDIYFRLPSTQDGAVYIVVRVEKDGERDRVTALKYNPYLRVWPLITPVPGGTRETGNVKTGTRNYQPLPGAPAQAEIRLRSAEHANAFDTSHSNVGRSAFERVELRLATSEDGTTSASGPVFSDSDGTSALPICDESTRGPVCTIQSADWPQGSQNPPLTQLLTAYFHVPVSFDDQVWLVASVKRAGSSDRVYSVRYDVPYAAYPLVVPAGTADGAGLTGSRNFLPGGARQQATAYLRSAWHDDEYNASDANVATSALGGVTIAIASSAAGTSTITGATISSDAAGTTALTGCSNTGPTCTLTIANWPATGGTTDGLSFYFSVPNTVSTAVYVVVEGIPTDASGKSDLGLALKYDPPLPVFPLAVPLGAADAHETGTLTSRTGNFAALGARNKARIYLRDAWHSNAYASTGQDNAPIADFSSVTIRVATGADGGTAVSGAAITNGSGGRLSQCASAGATCLVNNWPSSGGNAQPLDVWFTVPDSRTSNVYLHVTVRDSDGDMQTFAIPYQPPYVSAWPLIVPRPTSTTYETGTLATNTRRWLPETGVQQISIFLRDQARTSYLSSHGNAASSTYDGLAMKITSDAAGNTLLANATFTTSTGTPATCGNNCTPNLGFPFYFTIPDAHTGPVYIHLSVNKANKLNRATSLRWDPPLSVSAHPQALPLNADGDPAAPGEFNSRGLADRARVAVRAAASGSTGAAVANFDRVIITLASDAAGTALSGAKLSSDALGANALSACTESAAGNVCTVTAANWPATAGVAGNLDLYLSVPLSRAAAVYLHVRVENAAERDRTFALKYDAPTGAQATTSQPFPDPRLSDGTRERDDDGDESTENERYYQTGTAERVHLSIYAVSQSSWSGTARQAAFHSLDETTAIRLSASTASGTALTASHITFTQSDGSTALGCSEASYAGGDCTLTRDAWQALLGLTGAADSRRSHPFEFAFTVKSAFSSTEDVRVRVRVAHHDSSATGVAVVYKRGVAATTTGAQPFAMQLGANGAAETGNVVTRDPQRRYSPGGAATPVNLRVYESATELQTYSSTTNLVSYSTISQVTIEIKDRPSPSNRITGAQITVLQSDGTTSACTEAAATNVCTITAANYLLTGPPRAGNHYRAFPLDFSFTVPAAYQNTDFGNADLVVTVVRTGTGTLAARTKTFTLPFDGGTRAQPFAMVADSSGEAAADDQQWAVRGARTPIWAHIYSTAKTAFEAVTATNTAQYWEFDQSGAADKPAVKIELLNGATGTSGPPGGLITAAGSGEKFAPCTEAEPSNVCTITLAALKAYDSQASPGDTDAVDPLKFAVSIPQGAANSVRLKITVERSDMMTQTGEFHIYAPWAYPLLAPIGADGRPRTGSLSATVWEYEPRGRPTPLALELYNTRQDEYAAPTSALRPSFADFETVTIRVQDGDGDLITEAELTARNGTPLRGLCPVAASCEITRAEWQARQRGASSPGGLEFAAAVPAAHSAAAVIRIEVAHSGRTAPITAQPVNEQAAPSGPGPVQRIALEESSGVRTAVYELRMVSPAKRAFALPLVPDGEGGLRVCTEAESGSGDDALEACTEPTAQRGTPIGFAATLMRGLEAHPANPPTANMDELVQYNEITELEITATAGEIIHEALCPRAAAEHPIYQPAAQSVASTCTISSAALQAFQGAADSSKAISPLQLAYVPAAGSAATGEVELSYEIAGASPPEMIMKTLQFAHVAGPGKRAAGVFLDWSDPGSAYAAGAPAALFAIGRADSRATAAPAPRSALPGRVKTATFAELAEAKAVELTISQGAIAYDGESCAASAAGCTLSLSRAELMAGAGSPSASDPIGNLRAEYELPLGVAGPTTITLSARFAGEAAAAVGELAIAHPAVSAPVGSAYLPTDADGVIAAGATAEVAAGFTVAVDASGAGWGCARPDPSFLELNAAGTLLDACAAGLSRLPGGDPPSATAAWLIADSYLAITGPATWSVDGAGDGSKRLMLGGTWNGMRCGLAAKQGASTAGERDVACWITDAEGNRPSIAIDANAAEDVRITASLIPTRERRFHLFTGPGAQPSDRYAETAAVFRLAGDGNRGSLFRTATIDVGEPAPVAAVELARAGSASGPIPRGGKAELEVRITAAGGAAADAAAIASITLTATRGSLSGDLCPGSARSCTINGGPSTAFTAAVAANPNLPAAVGIDFTPPAGEGSTLISLAVTATGGGQPLFTDSLQLTFAGAASALRAAGDRLPLLHHRATADDDRDRIELEVEARDTAGNAAALPSATARVRDADGNVVAQGFLIERLCDTGASKCKYRVSSTATAAAPLASGRYSLEVDAGQAEATVPFGVAGPAYALDPVPAGPPLLGRQLAIQVDVSDADGNPVADGTAIRVRASAADGPSPLLLANPPSDGTDEQSAELSTKDGQATVTFVTASQGLAIVSFDALDGTRTSASAVHLVDARNAPAPGQPALADPTSPAAHLTDGAGRPADPTTTAGLTVWSPPPDAATATAADLLQELPGTQAIHLWNGRRWIRYATDQEGNPLPGSGLNFPLHPQDLLFIAR